MSDKYNLSNAKFGGGFAGDKGTQIGGTFNDYSPGGSASEAKAASELEVKTILILASNPKTSLPLRLDEEVREIDAGLQRAKKREQFDLKQRWAVRVRDVYQALLDFKPQIVHFSGHGTGDDGLALENETGKGEHPNLARRPKKRKIIREVSSRIMGRLYKCCL